MQNHKSCSTVRMEDQLLQCCSHDALLAVYGKISYPHSGFLQLHNVVFRFILCLTLLMVSQSF